LNHTRTGSSRFLLDAHSRCKPQISKSQKQESQANTLIDGKKDVKMTSMKTLPKMNISDDL